MRTRGLLLTLLVLVAMIAAFKEALLPPPPEPSPAALRQLVRSARIESMEGEVAVKRFGTVEFVPATKGQWLSNGDRLKTNPRAVAHLVFVDGATLDVRPESLIFIESATQDERRDALDVKSGGVQYQGPGREVWTPSGRWFPAGGTAQPVLVIRVAKDGVTEIQQTAGAGTMKTKTGQTVALAEGSGLSLDANGKASEVRTLLAAPTLLAPPDSAEVTFLDPSHATTVLLWKEVPGAASYRLMLDESALFPEPRVDRTRILGTSVEVEGLPVGRYYWQVAALDAAGKESVFGPFFRFGVRSARPGGNRVPLVLALLDLRGNVLQVKGTTAPGATVTVEGQKLAVDATGAFAESLTLANSGPQTITILATKAGVESAEVKRQLTAGAP